MVSCLGFCAFAAVGRIQSLDGELRSRKLHSAAPPPKKSALWEEVGQH